MTPEERKAAAAVMASDGPWEGRRRGSGKPWGDSPSPCWDWDVYEFRVKPKPIVRWVNVYDSYERSHLHMSRAEADEFMNKHEQRIACVRIEFLPGQFDE